MSKHPRVGVGVLIFRGDKVLVGKRSAHQHTHLVQDLQPERV